MFIRFDFPSSFIGPKIAYQSNESSLLWYLLHNDSQLKLLEHYALKTIIFVFFVSS